MTEVSSAASVALRARRLDITPAEYFAGKDCETPWLSQSVAHRMLDQTPLHAAHYHPLLGGAQRKATKAMSAGQILHTLLLGKGRDVDVIDAKDYRTKAAQEARDNALMSGFTPVLRHEYDDIMSSLEVMRSRLAEAGVRLDGEKEVCLEWYEEGKDHPILCRGMMDNVFIADGVIIDVKKAESAHPRACGRHMVDYGYDIQHAAYTSALTKLDPSLAGRVKMKFAFIEMSPPYCVMVGEPDGLMRELGAMKWARAVRLWERCLATSEWPGYPKETVQLECAPWQFEGEIIASAQS